MSTSVCRTLVALFAMFETCSASATCFDQSQSLLEMLSQRRYADASADFDAAMKLRLPPSKLQQSWEDLQKQVGSYKKFGTPQAGMARAASSSRVLTPIIFENVEMTAEVTCEGGHVKGLLFLPSVAEGVR